MNITVTEPQPVKVTVSTPEPTRIDVIHRKVEITVIDTEA